MADECAKGYGLILVCLPVASNTLVLDGLLEQHAQPRNGGAAARFRFVDESIGYVAIDLSCEPRLVLRVRCEFVVAG